MHTPCTETEFVKKYNDSTCSEGLEPSIYPAIAIPSFEYCHRLDEIIKDYNTSDFWDPHQCSNSCHEPGYGCLASTNSAYFKCTKNKLEVCIHPELHCNHHPDNAEDEQFEDCKDKYVEKFIVKEFATLRCPSKMNQNMDTVATVCDDIIVKHRSRSRSQVRSRSGPGQVPGQVQKVQGLRTKHLDLG